MAEHLDGFIAVDREAFIEYINKYPNILKKDVAGMFDPPIISYNDFTDSNEWPDSIVAYIIDGGHSSIPTTKNKYYIKFHVKVN